MIKYVICWVIWEYWWNRKILTLFHILKDLEIARNKVYDKQQNTHSLVPIEEIVEEEQDSIYFVNGIE